MKHVRTLLITLILSLINVQLINTNEPKLTIVFIIDQLSYSHLQKLGPYFHGALKLFVNNGIVYTEAIQPHAMPATATGHAALSTGTYASTHGWIANSWYDITNQRKIKCDAAPPEKAAVFKPDGSLYPYGRSSDNLMVDTISDQLVMQSTDWHNCQVFSLSIKSRSAIGTAGRLGKAIWFDQMHGHFTSSKAYFDALPEWISNFNRTHNVLKAHGLIWNQAFTKPRTEYHMAKNINHIYESPVGQHVIIDQTKEEPFEYFLQTPHANKLLLDLAYHCIKTHVSKRKPSKCIVWISLSSLDKLGHQYGAQGRETIDMIYHLDHQIQQFMNQIRNYCKRRDTLFVVTSDHGSCPIPELLNNIGYDAHRIFYNKLLQQMNTLILDKFGISDLILHFKTPQFYVDKKKLRILPKKKKRAIIKELKKFLTHQAGVKRVWSCKQLTRSCFQPTSINQYYKNQYYPGRSGQLIMQTLPYSQPTVYNHGTTHRSPYNYDTHIPLIFYQKGAFENETINTRVTSLQVPVTLARILNIPRPSASTVPLLPGIVPKIKTIYD